MANGDTSIWTDGKIARLRELWMTGLPTAEIGRRMNLSKNAVVGKAHRIGLPGRPSPTRPKGSGAARPVVRRAPRVTLPALRAVQASPPHSAPRAALAAPPDPPARPAFVRASEPCCWPFGTPRTPGFRMCDEPSLPGRAYCAEHRKLGVVKVLAPSDDAGLVA